MGIFLPAASAWGKSGSFARAAVLVEGVCCKVQGLYCKTFVFIRPRCGGVHGKYGAIGRQYASPGIFIVVLFPTNIYSMVDAGKISIYKFDQFMRVLVPCAIYFFFLFQQISRKVKWSPRSAVTRFIMVFEELIPESPTFRKVRYLIIQYPCPESPSR